MKEVIFPPNFIELINYKGNNPKKVFIKKYFISQWHMNIEECIAQYIGKKHDRGFDDINNKILKELSYSGYSQTFNDINEHFAFCINYREKLLSLVEDLVPNQELNFGHIWDEMTIISNAKYSINNAFKRIRHFKKRI